MFDNLVAGLCRNLGLDAPAAGTDGAFYLQVDELELGIVEESGNESLILQCLVGNLGADPRAEQLAELCEANYYWGATNGATIGLNRSTGEVTLAKEWPLAGLDNEKLLALVQGVIEAAEFWSARIGNGAAPVTSAGAGSLGNMIRA